MRYKIFLSAFFFLISFIGNLCVAQEPKLMLPIGHTEEISAAHFSPDGKKIVTVSADKTAKIWDVETGRLLADLKGHTAKVNFAVFSPEGKKIITASSDNILKIWNAETGRPETSLTGHKDERVSACFSPDGKKIITASTDNTARIWDVITGKSDTVLTRHTNSVKSAEFSSDGKNFLTASLDSVAILWDTKTDTLIATLQGHSSGLQFAHFSEDGKKVLTVSKSKKDTVKTKIWNAETGRIITDLKGDTSLIWSAYFSPDGKKIVTASQDQTAKIWDAETGKLDTVYEHDDAVISARYNKDGTKIVTASGDTAKLWDAVSGKLIVNLSGHTASVKSAEFSLDGKKIITASVDNTAKIWEADSGKLIADLKGHTSSVKFAGYSPDGKKIITVSSDSAARIWEAASGKFIANLNGVNYKSIRFSNDGKKIATASYVNTVKLWDAETGRLDSILTGNMASINAAVFSPDSNKIIIASIDKTARVRIWDFETSEYDSLLGHGREVNSVEFSTDGTKIVTASSDNSAIIWDAKTKKRIKKLEGHRLKVNNAVFSPDGKKIITASLDNTIRIWDAETYKYDSIFVKGPNGVQSIFYNLDGKKIVTVNVKFVSVWNAATRELIAEIKEYNNQFVSARFSPDSAGKKIVTIADDDTAKIWDAETGKVDAFLTGHEAVINSAEFSPDGKNIITASDDNTVKILDVKTGKCLYTFFAVDSLDYLVIDKDNHYDGSDPAMKLLYFTHGVEVISLAQVRGPLWIPGLAEQLNNGDTIHAKSLEELNVFGGFIPEIEITGDSENESRFSITPGRGGLGEIILFVNDIEARKFKKEQLNNINGVYEVTVKKESLRKYIVANEDNWISLKAKTSDNTVSSEEAKISIDKDNSPPDIKPNLYALMVGTSQYKELPKKIESNFAPQTINLSYPAIDARAISKTVERAARNMLNTDGKEHVFMYNLTTDNANALKPNKQTIKLMLDSISKKAEANDILLIFLSGHGVVGEVNGKKQFYYMTEDAANLKDEKTFAQVGISTDSLMDWIRLENIAANKRILILDACYSGQVINDLKKDIDRLKENSKMFILSASASDKSAFESDKIQHGYLTYSLLKAIKQQPDILEDGKNLNISRWFNAAGKLVSAIAEEENNNQKTHIFTVVDFNIGHVDSSVIKNIQLEKERPLFVASNFQNSRVIGDDQGFGNRVNDVLREIASSGSNSKIEYADVSKFTDAYTLSGRYTVTDKIVEVKFIIYKGTQIFKSFEKTPVKGTKDKLPGLAKSIAEKAVAWVSGHK